MFILMSLLACDEVANTTEVGSDDGSDGVGIIAGPGEVTVGDSGESEPVREFLVEVPQPLEGIACWFTEKNDKSSPTLMRISLETGEILDELTYTGSPADMGLARLGDEMVVPGQAEWTVVDLASGAWRSLGAPFGATTASSDGVQWYTLLSNRDVLLHSSVDTMPTPSGDAKVNTMFSDTRLAASSDYLYGAWHSTDHITEYDLNTGARRDIPLERYDTWVWGISATENALHLLDDGRSGYSSTWVERIVSFDPVSGAIVGELQLLESDPSGLWCEPI